MEERDEERKSTTSLWLDGLKGVKDEDLDTPLPARECVHSPAFSVTLRLKATFLPSIRANAIKDMAIGSTAT